MRGFQSRFPSRFLPLAMLGALPPLAAAAAERPPVLQEIAAAPEPARLRSTVEALVGFGTRHTLSDTASATRGIGAARRWTKARFEEISAACGECLTVAEFSQTVSGKRLPVPAQIVDVVAVQKGSTDPERVIVITGHIDSRVSDVMNATADAPGADDDASGVAVVLEAARVLSRHRFAATIVYGVLSGEEQGLYGGRLLAETAKAQGWRVEADLNNDIVGATRGQNGVAGNARVRLFSEGTRAVETPEEARQRRFEGGEDDSASRNVARFVKSVAERVLPGWTVVPVYRLDRFGRGGDHSAFNDAGFAAVRFTENAEDYRHQHQDLRNEGGIAYGDTIDHLDFDYLAKVAATNAVAAAAMALAPPPPLGVKAEGAASPDTKISWQASPGTPADAVFRVAWRETASPAWTSFRDAGAATSLTLAGIAVDDSVFGVASVSREGFESPVAFAGPSGAFWSRTAPGP